MRDINLIAFATGIYLVSCMHHPIVGVILILQSVALIKAY